MVISVEEYIYMSSLKAVEWLTSDTQFMSSAQFLAL